jgi:hypothetical protein
MFPIWVHIFQAPAFPKYFPLDHYVKQYQFFIFQIWNWFWTSLLSFTWQHHSAKYGQTVPSLKVGQPLPRAWKFLTVRWEVKPLPRTDLLLPLLLCHLSPHFKIHYLSSTRSGHALAQVISHLPLTAEDRAQIQSHAGPCGFCGEPSRTGFVPSTSVFLLSPFHPWFILVHSLITDIQSQ